MKQRPSSFLLVSAMTLATACSILISTRVLAQPQPDPNAESVHGPAGDQYEAKLQSLEKRIASLEGAVQQFDSLFAASLASDERWRNHLSTLLGAVGALAAGAALFFVPTWIRKQVNLSFAKSVETAVTERSQAAAENLEKEIRADFQEWNEKFKKLYDAVSQTQWGGQRDE